MKNTKKHIKLAELLAKEFIGKASDKEKEQLIFFEHEEETKQILSSAREKSFDIDHINKYKNYSVEKARKKIEWKIKFKQHSRTVKFWNVLRYASVIALPIALAGYIFYISGDMQINTYSLIPAKIEPGETKAQLYLSDGRIIDLENQKESFIKEKDGAVIKKDSSSLNYQFPLETETPEKIIENVVVTPVGGEYQLTLSDGTKVWLNALSEIRYPIKFSGDTRKVKVSGEVYFEVAKNRKTPFVVDVNNVEIKVLGTQFNVKAYPNDDSIETTLIEGAVRLKATGLSGNVTSVDLAPGFQASFNRSSKNMNTRKVHVENYIAWKDGKFIFQSEKLSNIMRKLERWYDVKVFFENQNLKDLLFSARMNRYGNINDLLTKFEQTTNVKFEIKNNIILIKEH
jgi:hypothetical protein